MPRVMLTTRNISCRNHVHVSLRAYVHTLLFDIQVKSECQLADSEQRREREKPTPGPGPSLLLRIFFLNLPRPYNPRRELNLTLSLHCPSQMPSLLTGHWARDLWEALKPATPLRRRTAPPAAIARRGRLCFRLGCWVLGGSFKGWL